MSEKLAIPREELMARLELPETKAALSKLAKRYRLQFIVLFGSYATDRVTPMSDIDIAVLPGKGGPKDVWRMWVDLAKVVGSEKVGLVDLRRATPLLAHEIGKHGIPLIAEDLREWAHLRTDFMKQYDVVRKFETVRLALLDRKLEAWALRSA